MTGVKQSTSYGILGNVENAWATPTNINPNTTGVMLSHNPQKGASIILPTKQRINESDIRNVFCTCF
jgi:hypothetical protein